MIIMSITAITIDGDENIEIEGNTKTNISPRLNQIREIEEGLEASDISITTTNTSTKTDNKEIDWSGFDFSEEVKSKIIEWLEYKKEKKQSYKNRGFSAFCKQRYEEILKYGDRYVIEAIDYSMCQNYSGVFPPKNNTKGATNEVNSGDTKHSDIKGIVIL